STCCREDDERLLRRTHRSTSKTIQGFCVDPDGCTRRRTRRTSSCNQQSETERRGPAQQHRRQAFDVARVSSVFRRSKPDEALYLSASDDSGAIRGVSRVCAWANHWLSV